MRDRMMGALERARETFSSFSAGQKAVAVIGTAALLIGAVMVFRWVSTPSYAPLYSDLSGSDASAVVDELDSEGVPYKITDGGGTIMVPKSDVYSTRIALNGKGLPTTDAGGYDLLDNQSLSTSESQEQTDFKRAMEGELDKTIEAMDGIDTAVVHLALPEKQVFSDQQDPATASVLVATTPGVTLTDEQVQAIVHLTASSIDGLDPNQITVTDAAGNVLAMPGQDDGTGGGLTGNRYDQVEQFENDMQGEVQQMLDTIFGPGNAKATVTADLDFDHATIESRTYSLPKDPSTMIPLSESRSAETYKGPGAAGAAGGVVGPDGQMDPSAAAGGQDSAYANRSSTQDNPIGQTVEHRETAPGSVKSIHIGAVVDTAAAAGHDLDEVSDLIRDSVGIDRKRGDTIEATQMAFDHSAQEEAQQELAAAQKAKSDAAKHAMYRNIAIGGGIALLVLLAWALARRRAKAREQATSYVVEQLRADAAARVPIEAPAPAVAALEAVEDSEDDRVRDELIALVERQPEDVAALLRGWLVEPR